MFLIGGYSDFYIDVVFRMVEYFNCFVRVFIGLWFYVWFVDFLLGFRIDYFKECVRWWDCYLKGFFIDVMKEFLIRIFLRDGMMF